MGLIGIAVAFVLAASLASFAVEGQKAAIPVIGFVWRASRLMGSPDRRRDCRGVAIEDSTLLPILGTLRSNTLVDLDGWLSDRRRRTWRSGRGS